MASFNCFTVVSFTFDFLNFRFRVLCLCFILLGLVRWHLFTLPFDFREFFRFFRFDRFFASGLRFQFIIFAFSDFTLGLRLLSFAKSLIRFFQCKVCFRSWFNNDFIRGVGDLVQRRAINSMTTA